MAPKSQENGKCDVRKVSQTKVKQLARSTKSVRSGVVENINVIIEKYKKASSKKRVALYYAPSANINIFTKGTKKLTKSRSQSKKEPLPGYMYAVHTVKEPSRDNYYEVDYSHYYDGYLNNATTYDSDDSSVEEESEDDSDMDTVPIAKRKAPKKPASKKKSGSKKQASSKVGPRVVVYKYL